MLIFDLDGTLIDSRRDIAIACNAALKTMGRHQLDVEEIATYVGDGARKLVQRALQTDDPELVDRGLDAFLDYYLKNPVVHTKPMPGAIEALDAMKRWPLAIATNKRREVAVAVLHELRLLDRFADLWGGGDAAPKPDPACVRMLAERAGMPLDRIWMIGDGVQDIGAGKNAGVRTIAILGGFHDEAKLRALSPDHVVGDLRAVPDIITAEAARPRSP